MKRSFLFVFGVLISLLLASYPVRAATTPEASTQLEATILSPSAFSIRLVADKIGNVNPGDEITYTLFFANLSDAKAESVNLSLNWGFESDIVADYVSGSAKPTYGGSLPSIDPLNQTITWSIPTLPPGLAVQQASFKLRTNLTHPYPGSYVFYVEGFLVIGQTTVAKADRVTNSVTYKESLPPPGPVVPSGLLISEVRLLEITAHHALVTWRTSQAVNSLIRYGLSKAYGLEVSSRSQHSQDHIASLDGLDAETIYHFQVFASDGKTEVGSDDYSFKTAREGIRVPTVDVGSLLFRVDNLRLHANTQGVLAIFAKLNHEVELPVYGEGLVVYLDLSGRRLQMFLQEAPWFSGNFTSPDGLGDYPITAEVKDQAGNFVKADLALLSVVPRPKILETAGKPIRGAVVSLYRFDPFINRFALFDLKQFDQENPITTGAKGEFGWVIPYGRYEIRVEAVGFQPYRSAEIVMLYNGILADSIYLTKVPLGFLAKSYYQLKYVWARITGYLADLWQSLLQASLLEKLAWPLLVLTSLAVFWEFLSRTGLTLLTLPKFLFFFFLTKKGKPWGEIRDTASGQTVSLVYVELFDIEEGKKAWTFTNRKGEFGFNQPPGDYFLKLVKHGYQIPDWELVVDPDRPRLGKLIKISRGTEETWLQIWLSRSLKVSGRPLLSRAVEIVEGILLNLATFTLILGLLSGVILVVKQPTYSSGVVLALYLMLTLLWTILLWFK